LPDNPLSGGLEVAVAKRLDAFSLDAAFSVPAQGVTALFGRSGAGKSATLGAVAGAVRPDRGRIALGDRVLFDKDAGIDVPMERRAIGWVFQDARLFPHLSVRANLDYGARRARGRDAGVRFDEVLSVLGIELLLARRPARLSGGERQRVAIGRALLSQPSLLLMDEPLSALDAPRRAEILPFLARLKTCFALPILYVTHSLAEVVRLADQLVVLDEGRVAAQGALADVLARADLTLLSSRADAAATLDGVVAEHLTERGLTRLRMGDVDLFAPRLHQSLGEPVRAIVLARDVLLARVRPEAISARNILAGRIAGLASRPDGSVMVRVALDGGPALLAAITADAVQSLGLSAGEPIWAILKSVAVEGAAPGGLLAMFDD
jgi:molybdate transport system ATP-binding protein